MNREIKARLKWIELYKETRNAGLVCRHCGILRPTLRKWFRRYDELGVDGLYNKSTRSLRSPNKKETGEQERLILDLRRKRKLGAGLVGLVIGFLAGLLGIGGGVFVVPLLIYFLNIPTKTAAASSVFIVCFSSWTGFATHAFMHRMDWKFLFLAAIFSFAGGQIGSRTMAEKLGEKTVRIMFGGVLMLFCAKLLYRVII
ncbi:MAG: TSUP family transporter [Desulfobacteraceae bacterium]|nr:TSUP family transporter [Desulfobacteraceae bacterium]